MLPEPLQDPTMLMEVSEATWRKLFDTAGESQRLAGRSFKHSDIQASFESQPPGTALFRALELIHELGTDDGRIHIEQVAQDKPVKLPISPETTAAREFVAQLWINGSSNADIAEVLQRAQLTHRPPDSSRTYREFACPGGAPDAGIDQDRLKEIISEWCRANGRSEVLSITTHEFNGEWFGHVLRGDPIRRVPEVREQRLNLLEYQPAASDLIRYDRKTGRIGIATRSPHLLNAYRESMGTLLAGNDQLFAGENVCSLRRLQLEKNGLFAAQSVLGISRVDVVQLLWSRGEKDKVWVSGRDCFKILDDLQAKLLEGSLIEARLKIHFTGGGRAGDVVLKVPNIIRIRGPHPHLVEQLLDASGLRGSFEDDGTPRNFWSEYPWRQKEAVWRRKLGGDFDRLRKNGSLRAIAHDAVEHPDHLGAGQALEVEALAPGVAIGHSADPAIGVRTLTSTDVEGYQLQIPALARELQAIMGLDGACQEIAPNSGVVSLGTRAFGSNMPMAAFLVTREPATHTAALIEQAAAGATPLALYPLDCRPIANIDSIPCRIPHGPHQSLLEAAVRCLKWHGQIAPTVWSFADLIVDTIRGVITYRGIEISGVQPGTHPFKFAERVARGKGELVATNDLNDHLSPGRPDNDAAKTAKSDFRRAFKAAHEKAGQTVPADIFGSTRSVGYWLKGSTLVLG